MYSFFTFVTLTTSYKITLAKINNQKGSSHEGIICGKYQYHKYKSEGDEGRWSVESKCLKNAKFQVASPRIVGAYIFIMQRTIKTFFPQ